MIPMKRTLLTLAFALPIAALLAVTAAAEDKPAADAGSISLNEGAVKMAVPKGWEKKQPRTRIVDFEFAVPAVEGDEIDGRVTVMGAGGSVEANIDRWIGQFSQPDNKPTTERTKKEELKVAGQTVHVVDISGIFKDQRGPFAPATLRRNYRMLGAIVVTDKQGQYFVKMYGPEKTIAANEKAFNEMVKSLQVKAAD